MIPRHVSFTLISLLGIATIPSFADEAPAAEDREVGNLTAFVRVYGYVRFFYLDKAIEVVESSTSPDGRIARQ